MVSTGQSKFTAPYCTCVPSKDGSAAQGCREPWPCSKVCLSWKLCHAEEFNRAVGHKPNHPMFVYDSDGIRSGGLWYLYFRVVDRLADDAARRKAADLGLREGTEGEAGTMWVAIQQHLRGLK